MFLWQNPLKHWIKYIIFVFTGKKNHSVRQNRKRYKRKYPDFKNNGNYNFFNNRRYNHSQKQYGKNKNSRKN